MSELEKLTTTQAVAKAWYQKNKERLRVLANTPERIAARRTSSKIYYKKNKEKIKEKRKAYNFDPEKLAERNKRKIAYRKKYRTTTIVGKFETTICSMRRRAKKKGIPFSVTAPYLASIMPITCPVLGIPLAHNTGGGKALLSSPSVDRLEPEKGYVKGNIIIVSFLANMIRSCGTPDQIIAVGQFYKKLLTSNPNSCIIDSEN